MATTYIDIVNRCLRKLGEFELPGASTDLETDYQKLLGQMINDVKEEVEDATNWRSLRQILNPTILADEGSGIISEANERSRLVRIYQSERVGVSGQSPGGIITPGGGYIPLVFDVTDSTNPQPLKEVDLSELVWRDQLQPDSRASSAPAWFALDNSTVGDELVIHVFPRPSTARTLQVTLCVPQDRLRDNELQNVIQVPTRPVFVGAMYHAYEERGEELGPDSLFTEKRFQEAMNTAISRDEAEAGNQFELIVA